jgi:hypothetical protein
MFYLNLTLLIEKEEELSPENTRALNPQYFIYLNSIFNNINKKFKIFLK